jgi:hypothetical protein
MRVQESLEDISELKILTASIKKISAFHILFEAVVTSSEFTALEWQVY